MRRTPWVFRPMTRSSPTASRMILPVSVTSITSSVSDTWVTPTIDPVFSVTLRVMTPFPPRDWTRYSPMAVRLPNPFSVTVRRVPWGWRISIPTTASPSSRSIPRTPTAARPIGRTSSSWNRMDIPCRVERKTSSWLEVIAVAISWSPSFRPIAMMPPARGLEYSMSSVFLMTPCAVAVTTCFPSTNSRTGRIAETDSPGDRDSRFTIARPFAARLASGSSWTFIQYTLPVVEKNMM